MALPNEIEPFVVAARRYVDLVETAHRLPLGCRLREFAEALAELYLWGLRLPHLQPTERDLPRLRPSVANWPGLGPCEGYWELFDPYILDEPVETVLTDDLLDIYYDLLPGLEVINSGRAEDLADAVWDWRFSLAIHWGAHAVDALRVLQRAIAHTEETGAPDANA